MKSKFDKYWDEPNKILLVASLLDPRYKLTFSKYCLMRVYGEEVEEVADRKANYDLIWFKHIILITKTCNKGVPKVTFHHLPKSWFFKYVVFGVWKMKARAGICFVQAEKPTSSLKKVRS